MLLLVLSEGIAKFVRLSLFPQALVSPSFFVCILAIPFFGAIDIASNIDGSIFPYTLSIPMNLAAMKLTYIIQISSFKAGIAAHSTLIKISFIFRAISKH